MSRALESFGAVTLRQTQQIGLELFNAERPRIAPLELETKTPVLQNLTGSDFHASPTRQWSRQTQNHSVAKVCR